MTRPKRVLFFRPTLGEGGADRVTWTLLRQLDRTRFAPSLALMRAEGPFLADLPRDVPVHILGSRRLATSTLPLARLLRANTPDVVFSTASAANIVAVAAHRLARAKARLVLSERNALFRGRAADPKQKLEVALKRLLYRGADLVTAVSQGVADQLVDDIGVPRARVAVVYNPMVEDNVEQAMAEPVTHPWFVDDAHDQVPIIVACARLVAQKDYATLLDAFELVRAKQPARLFVLGEGPLRSELEQRAHARGIADDVCFFGFDKNPFKYMARSKLLMHASRAEGLPGALIQTMACGTPVVSTDCDFGPREVITRSGTDGFLAPVGDARALADYALRLLNDEPLRGAIGRAAQASASRFSTHASLARYEAAIEG